MTRVVCDSGPLTHLWQISQWQAFHTFDAIHVPEPVAREVARHVSLAQLTVVTGRDVSVDAVSEQEIAAARWVVPANLTCMRLIWRRWRWRTGRRLIWC
jgi:hypothetical protein